MAAIHPFRCSVCPFLDPKNETEGRCRVNPPQAELHPRFPKVNPKEDWCGRHPQLVSAIAENLERQAFERMSAMQNLAQHQSKLVVPTPDGLIS